jgi:Putative prokaryotic signal transducing protein
MKELITTNDIVMISYVESLLIDRGIAPMVFDENFSILDGSVGVIPRRVMVTDDDFVAARRVLEGAGLADELGEA